VNSVYDLTRDGLHDRMPDALVAAMDRVELALTQECSVLAAGGDPRGALPSAVARRSGESLTDTRVFLNRLVDMGAATRHAGTARTARYRAVKS